MTDPGGYFVRDMAEAKYHADPCDGPSLSSSIAKVIYADSLAHAYLAHPKLGGERPEPKTAWDDGSIVHKLLLGKGAKICEIDHADFRTKEAKYLRDKAREAGEIPVLKRHLKELQEAATGIRNRMAKMGLAFGEDTEVSGFWIQDGVSCRMRVDDLHVDENEVVITDFKTIKRASQEECEKAVENLGYDIQRAAYISAIEHIMPAYVGRVRFQWVFAEIKKPYAVTPMTAGGTMAHMGEAKWQQAVDRWRDALETDEWPCYVEGPVVGQPPYWAAKRFYETVEDE